MIKNLEIKPLCHLILKKTIDDEDKYQAGLTKIFFRAGMLAALESLRSERLNALVVLIQKNVRRRLAVTRYQSMRKAAIKIQTWWRGILARRFVAKIRREVSALRLQTAIRRFLQRRKLLLVRHTITSIQSRKYEFHVKQCCLTYLLARHTRCKRPETLQRIEIFARGCPSAESFPWQVRNAAHK